MQIEEMLSIIKKENIKEIDYCFKLFGLSFYKD